MNDRLRRVVKAKPPKIMPETEAIFEPVHQVNQEADEEETNLRISLEAKAMVKVSDSDRGGKKSGDQSGTLTMIFSPTPS
jgi:hypothetical protein